MPASLQDGGDEEATIFYNELKKEAMKNMAGTGYLGIDDYAKPAPPVPLSTNKDFFRQMYGESGGIDPSEHNPFFEALAKDAKTEVSVFEPQPYVPPRMNIDSYEYDGSYDPAPYSDAAIEAVVANTINRNKAAEAEATARAQAEATARAQAEATARAQAAEKARQAEAAQKRMNNSYETGPVARAPAPVARPTAPAGGYSTKQSNNSFATRRDIRNIFA